MPLIVLMALGIFLPLRSLADEAVPVAAAPASSAMVQDPCPPPLPMPEQMGAVVARILNPGNIDAEAQGSSSRPEEVQAHVKALQERARTDWPNLCRYRAANAAQAHPARVVFIGDSITELWAEADHELFSKGVVGRGISGQTSPQMLLRFSQDVIELHPKRVHILAGTNDLAGNTGPSALQDFKNNIMAMVELAHVHHIKVALASIPPARIFPWKPQLRPAGDIVALNSWLRSYAVESRSEYVDYYSALVDEQGGFRAALSNDGVHPNRDGYSKMRVLALQVVSR